jgi:hypothetical protein
MGAWSLDREPAKVVFTFESKVLSKAFGSASDDRRVLESHQGGAPASPPRSSKG